MGIALSRLVEVCARPGLAPVRLAPPRRLALGRRCSLCPCGTLAAMTLTMILASIQAPSTAGATRTSAGKVLASLVSLTEGPGVQARPHG